MRRSGALVGRDGGRPIRGRTGTECLAQRCRRIRRPTPFVAEGAPVAQHRLRNPPAIARRAVRPAGGHSARIRTLWAAAAAVVLVGAGTGLAAWAMNAAPNGSGTEQNAPVTSLPPPVKSLPAPVVSTLPTPGSPSDSAPASSSARAPQAAPTTAVVPLDPTATTTASVGAPAVVSSLGPNDPGFGWNTTIPAT
jgi:hypothetical protein